MSTFVLAADALLSTATLPLLPRALVDESAHVATTLLLSPELPESPAAWTALLAGTTLLDLDHLPRMLGITRSRRASGRPPGHSLLTILPAAFLLRLLRLRQASLTRPLALGIALHLLRDMAMGGVPLLWPFGPRRMLLPFPLYLALLLTPRCTSVRITRLNAVNERRSSCPESLTRD